jgi:tRNA(fMet)-specific endonuclease VapC
MSLFVLDTDILSLYQAGDATVCHRVDSQPSAELAITVMTVEEELSGWYTLVRQAKRKDELAHAYRRLGDTVRFLARWRIIFYTEPAIERYDQLRALKLKVSKMDLRIAAIALENGGTLVTRNLRDFQRVPKLTCENWAA